jgi:HK97 family phage portal protein
MDTFKRDTSGINVTVGNPRITWINGGVQIRQDEALYATQVDLDRSGNTFGVITKRNGSNLPAEIELVSLSQVSVTPRRSAAGGPAEDWVWRIGGVEYDYADLWHERQYIISGFPMGLNAIAYAAYAVGSYLSAQDFAIKWFSADALPAAVLKNEEEEVSQPVIQAAKAQYAASMTPGGVFVTGRDWSLTPVNAANESNRYIEQMQASVPDIARFFDVPADIIDGAVSGSAITYANITQRFTQLVTIHLGPSITRRELALSTLSSGGRFTKLNRRALLAMDPMTQAQLLGLEIDKRMTTVTEARRLQDKAPLTAEDKNEFKDLFGDKNPPPKPAAPAENGVPA